MIMKTVIERYKIFITMIEIFNIPTPLKNINPAIFLGIQTYQACLYPSIIIITAVTDTEFISESKTLAAQ